MLFSIKSENLKLASRSRDYMRKGTIENLKTCQPSGGEQGGLNLPLPVPFNPGSPPVIFGSRLFAFFRLRNLAQCCVIFPFFSRFPPPWESRFPPPLLPPPVHLPPPFLPASRPPVPPPQPSEQNKTLFVSRPKQRIFIVPDETDVWETVTFEK